MSRIENAIKEAKESRGGALIPFVTTGDPSLPASLQIILDLADQGADVIELGVPFSDPIADGPTIQRSSERALSNGVSLKQVLEVASQFRAQKDVPIVLFSYLNPIMRFGFDEFARSARKAGVDGLLITDVIDDEASAVGDQLAQEDIDLISLVAPTTTNERLEKICSRARGFVYAVSRTGVTGARNETSSTAEALVQRTRQFTDLPIAVGFGISSRDQVLDVWRYADGAVIGSAIVSEIERSPTHEGAAHRVGQFIRGLGLPVAKHGVGT